MLRNSEVEKELNRKTKVRYLGPFRVHTVHTQGHSFILAELNGAIWNKKVAAFRVIPYVTRHDPRLLRLQDINIPPPPELTESESESEPESGSDAEEF